MTETEESMLRLFLQLFPWAVYWECCLDQMPCVDSGSAAPKFVHQIPEHLGRDSSRVRERWLCLPWCRRCWTANLIASPWSWGHCMLYHLSLGEKCCCCRTSSPWQKSTASLRSWRRLFQGKKHMCNKQFCIELVFLSVSSWTLWCPTETGSSLPSDRLASSFWRVCGLVCWSRIGWT